MRKPSESIDHVLPRSQGGLSTTENWVPACLSCNGINQMKMLCIGIEDKNFMILARAMAIRAWLEGDLRLAIRLLQWANPNFKIINKNYEKINQNIKQLDYQTLIIF